MTDAWIGAKTVGLSWLLAAFLALSATSANAAPEDEVLAHMDKWAATYASATSPDEMTALYTPDAVFWGTGGREPFLGPDAFAPYFANQFDNATNRHVEFHNPQIRIYGDGMFATSTGTYAFDVTLLDGRRIQVEHRYSFALVKVDGQWLIAQHHSSAMP